MWCSRHATAGLKPATKEFTDSIIGRALAPPGRPEFNVKQYQNRHPDKPVELRLYDPQFANLETENEEEREHNAAGTILISFELRLAGTFKDKVILGSRARARSRSRLSSG